MKAGDFNPPHSHGADLSHLWQFPDVPKEIAEECAAFKGTMRGPGGISWTYGEGDKTCMTQCGASVTGNRGSLYFPCHVEALCFSF